MLTDQLTTFRDRLASNERVVSSGKSHVIDKAVSWLLTARRDAGYWGVEDVAETSLCCIAIASWQPDQARELLAPSVEWLLSEQLDGLWDTGWDTGVAVRALSAARTRADERYSTSLSRLRELDPRDVTFEEGPHHAAQVLMALHATGARGSDLHEWSKCVVRGMKRRREVYVLGQGVRAVLECGTGDTLLISEEIDELKDYLESRTRPSEAELRSFGPALEALAFVPECRELTLEKSATVVSTWSDKRAWYKSPRQTASALVALHAVGGTVEIVVDKPSFNAHFERAFRELPVVQRRERRISVMLGALAVALMVATIAVLVFWGSSDSLVINGVAVSVLAISIPAVARSLWIRVR